MLNSNQIEPKMKYYNDTIKPTANYNVDTNLVDVNLNTIKESNINTRREKYELSTVLLDRQFAGMLQGSELESNLIKPQDCLAKDRSYLTDNINNNVNLSNNTLDSAYGLLLDEKSYKELSNKFNISCSAKKQNTNWGDYRAPPQQTNGRGFGNPSDYDKTYLGVDSRNDRNQDNSRDIDLKDRNIIPLDSFRINYANLAYDLDSRCGVSTRTYKKAQTSFN